MQFEWDESKRLSNLEKHGVDFEDAITIWNDTVIEIPDHRRDYAEPRLIALSTVNGRELVVAYTPRGDTRRIISARKANDRERRAYHAALDRRAEAGTH